MISIFVQNVPLIIAYNPTNKIVLSILEGFSVRFAVHYFFKLKPFLSLNCSMNIVSQDGTKCFLNAFKPHLTFEIYVSQNRVQKLLISLKLFSCSNLEIWTTEKAEAYLETYDAHGNAPSQHIKQKQYAIRNYSSPTDYSIDIEIQR